MLTEKVVLNGRKIPISTMRHDLFKKHEKYMHLSKDLEYEKMSRHEVMEKLRKINEYSDDNKLTELNILIDNMRQQDTS